MQKGLLPMVRLLSCFAMVVFVLIALPDANAISLQERVVQGRVTSSDDQTGLPGVNILVKGTTRGTVSDADGNFSLAVPEENTVLVFSAIGYSSQEVPFTGQTTLDVVLNTDVTSLSEVVVVGYGTVRKSDVTGALSRVTASTIQERPVQNVLQALQGQAAGMNVATNMRPGELPVVNIRGNRSINGPNGPLYVIDGIPIVAAPNSGSTPAAVGDINPNDIASVEVLKDASATAIYGSRGANGVIIITTKKGEKGKVSVHYNTTLSVDSYNDLTDWMNGGQYFDRWRLSVMNGRQYQTPANGDLTQAPEIWYPDPELDKTKIAGLSADTRAVEALMSGYKWEDREAGIVAMRPTTDAEQAMGWPAEVPDYDSRRIKTYDWTKDATQRGLTQNHQISLSSGTDQSKLYLSLGYYDQKGIQVDQGYKRYNGLITGELSPTKWFTLGSSVNVAFSTQDFGIHPPNTSNTGSKDLYSRAVNQFPFLSPVDANGEYIRSPQLNLDVFNPLIDIGQSKNERRATSMIGSMFAEVKLRDWIKYRVNFGVQYRDFRNGRFTGPRATPHLSAKANTAAYNSDETFSWVAENLLYLDKTFANDHVVGITLLQSAQKFRQEGVNAGAENTVNENAEWYDLGANVLGRAAAYGSNFSENTLMSFMARANYTYRDKYLLTATARMDGASVLAPGNKWDFFPSFALAWKMHQENFMSNVGWIDELKPRVGFGSVGSASIAPYQSSGPLSRNMYVFGSTPVAGYLPQLAPNPGLSWERTTQWNFGVDISTMEGRISGSIDLYKANTSDLLFERTPAATSGYIRQFDNVGETENRGIEIAISARAFEKGDFSWRIDVNWSSNREEIVGLINGKNDMLAQRLFIGEPLQTYFHYKYDRIWTSSEEDLAEMAKYRANGVQVYPGTIKVVDRLTVDSDGDGKNDAPDYRIDASDYTILGSDRPKWTGGITNTFRYKNWELSSFIYARVGQTYFGGFPNSFGGRFPNGRVENDVWSYKNQDARYPMPTTAAVFSPTASMQFNDGSFAIVRNISLSYSLPDKFLSKIFLRSLSLNAQVLNPFFLYGGDVVKLGLNPDDTTNWNSQSLANQPNTAPLGGMNTNNVLSQSWVFGLRAGL